MHHKLLFLFFESNNDELEEDDGHEEYGDEEYGDEEDGEEEDEEEVDEEEVDEEDDQWEGKVKPAALHKKSVRNPHKDLLYRPKQKLAII